MHTVNTVVPTIFIYLSIQDGDLLFGPTECLGESSSCQAFNAVDKLKSSKGPNLLLQRFQRPHCLGILQILGEVTKRLSFGQVPTGTLNAFSSTSRPAQLHLLIRGVKPPGIPIFPQASMRVVSRPFHSKSKVHIINNFKFE